MPKKLRGFNIIILFIVNLVFFFSFCLVQPVRAAGASLYLSPSSGSFLVGSTFTVSIFVNTEGNEINLVWADLKFPSDKIQITSPTAGTSFITEWTIPPNYSNEKGIVSFRGGIPGGIVTSAGLVSSITFRVISSGEANIEFGEESKILLNDGKGTNILSVIRDGKYNFLIPPPEGPQVFSSTHLNSDVWYPDSSPSFYWEKEEGANDFSWSFDQNPNGRPDGISEGNQNEVSFSNTSDGIWYFHIRQKKEEIWGQTSHVAVRIDTTPPRDFNPRIETYTKLAGYQTMIYFETIDDSSGIDHYEVSLIDLNTPDSSHSFFTEEISPYKVPFKNAGKYNVIIKAVDKAGNSREKEARFRMVTPLFSHLEGVGLKIKEIIIPWWVIIVIIFGGLFIIFLCWIMKRRNKITQ